VHCRELKRGAWEGVGGRQLSVRWVLLYVVSNRGFLLYEPDP
jgi:hypothetical protein